MTIKVIYFTRKGRGLPIRMCLEHGSVPYEFCPISMEDWPKRKAEFPNGQLPVLEVDGKQICQTAAILDVVSEKAGIALKDPMQVEWQVHRSNPLDSLNGAEQGLD
eukprot:Selendium_serpulae@DN5961_c0_g1_i2.p4